MVLLSFLKIAFKRCANSGSGAVEEDALVAFGNAEQLAGFLCRPALDVSQGDDLSLIGGERRNGLFEMGLCFLREQALLGEIMPIRRQGGPVARSWVIRRVETIRVDGERRQIRLKIWERGEREAASFTLRSRFSAVGEDAEHPGLEGGTPFKAMQSLKHRHPRLLYHFFRHHRRCHID